jgi:hypothetical protein
VIARQTKREREKRVEQQQGRDSNSDSKISRQQGAYRDGNDRKRKMVIDSRKKRKQRR